MLNLTLIIFELTAEQEEAQRQADEMEIDIEPKLEECVKVPMTFHVIENVKPIGSYCLVSSGGYFYTINESADSVNAKIAERQSFKLN